MKRSLSPLLLVCAIALVILAAAGISSGASSGAAAPVPAAQSDTLSVSIIGYLGDLDEETDWKTCGNCGNSGATGATATYSQSLVKQPSRDGLAAIFAINGKGQAYANGFWYHENGAQSAATNFDYEFDLLVPASSAAVSQAIEFQLQQNISGRVYNMAWQAEMKSKRWRVFNIEERKWEATQIPVSLAPDVWHHVKATFRRNPDGTVTHLDLVVDGVDYPVNVTHNSVLKYSSTSNSFNNAFQLDSDSKGEAYYVVADKMTVKYW